MRDVSDYGLYGNIAAEDLECTAMRTDQNWTYDVDTFGVCVSAYMLLYGSYIDVVQDKMSKSWQLRKPLRRYWQQHLWRPFFDFLLNMSNDSEETPPQDSSSVVDKYASFLTEMRVSFDLYLNNDKERKQLVSLLASQERALLTNKRI